MRGAYERTSVDQKIQRHQSAREADWLVRRYYDEIYVYCWRQMVQAKRR